MYREMKLRGYLECKYSIVKAAGELFPDNRLPYFTRISLECEPARAFPVRDASSANVSSCEISLNSANN